jgi:hypothetical protein
MTTLEVDRTSEIPDHVARRVMLAEGHRDEVELYEAFECIRANRPLARAVLDGYPPYWLVSKHGLILCYPSANRDDAIFDDPNSFRFDRRPNEPRYVLSNFVGGLKNLPVRMQLR